MTAALIRLRINVRFRDCDPLGHVNNAVYLTYLEQARLLLWRRQFGFLPRAVPPGGRRGQAFILARAEIDFRAQAYAGDDLEVRLGLSGFGRSSATYEYEIVDVATGTVIATARTVQVWFDYDESRSVPITDELKTTLSKPVE